MLQYTQLSFCFRFVVVCYLLLSQKNALFYCSRSGAFDKGLFFLLNKVILKAFKEADLAPLLQSIPKAVSPALVQMYLQTKAFLW